MLKFSQSMHIDPFSDSNYRAQIIQMRYHDTRHMLSAVCIWRCWNNQQVTVITPVVVNLRLSLRAIHWMSPELADTVLVRHVRNLKAAWSSIWWTYQNSSKFTFAQLLCPAWACFWISRSNRKIGQPVRTSHGWSPLHCTKCSLWAQ